MIFLTDSVFVVYRRQYMWVSFTFDNISVRDVSEDLSGLYSSVVPIFGKAGCMCIVKHCLFDF
jgi:hypothetical protein